MRTGRAARLLDESADGRETARAAGAAKYLASELTIRAVDTAIDTFGGKGFDEDHGIIHRGERARLLRASPTSNALILSQVAERRLGPPRSY